MCTVSWLLGEDGYELFCNRDERRTRKAARAPGIRTKGGVHFVAPADGDHGGSWVGANEHGLSLCLLNSYEGGQPSEGVASRSRGLLLVDLMDCRTVAEVRARASGMELLSYQPFIMLALRAGEPSLLIRWTGDERFFEHNVEHRMPLTSSSFKPEEVTSARRELFRRMVAREGRASAPLLRDFHRSHEPSRGAHSVCMHRADAATVSFSHVKVTTQAIEFSYQPQSPCAGAPPEVLTLETARGSL